MLRRGQIGRRGPPFALAVPVVLACGAAACLALNLPGQLTYDSVVQLADGRAGVYNTWHPPVMAWLLGLGDAVIRGAGLFVVLDVLLVFGGLCGFAQLSGRAGWRVALLAALLCASPLLLIYPGIVWKDVLFAAAATAGFAAIGQAGRWWASPVRRWAFLAVALALVVLAVLARQNGAVIAPIAAATLGLVVAGQSPRRRAARKALAAAAVFLAATAAATIAATLALNARATGEPARRHQLEDLQTYDLVGALALDPGFRLDVLKAERPGFEQQLRTAGLAAYTPERVDPIVRLPGLVAGRDRNAAAIAAQWRALVLGHPLLYLRVRARLFGWVLLTPRPELCLPVYVGVDGPPLEMNRLGLKPRVSARDDALDAYGQMFVGGPVISHAVYGVLGLVLLGWMVWRRRCEDIAPAGLLLSAYGFTATFALLSVACDYRYLYFLDLAVMAASLHMAAMPGLGRQSQAGPDASGRSWAEERASAER